MIESIKTSVFSKIRQPFQRLARTLYAITPYLTQYNTMSASNNSCRFKLNLHIAYLLDILNKNQSKFCLGILGGTNLSGSNGIQASTIKGEPLLSSRWRVTMAKLFTTLFSFSINLLNTSQKYTAYFAIAIGLNKGTLMSPNAYVDMHQLPCPASKASLLFPSTRSSHPSPLSTKTFSSYLNHKFNQH